MRSLIIAIVMTLALAVPASASSDSPGLVTNAQINQTHVTQTQRHINKLYDVRGETVRVEAGTDGTRRKTVFYPAVNDSVVSIQYLRHPHHWRVENAYVASR